MHPGAKVLYLGAASGTSVSHVADLVGPTGNVYGVEFSHRSGRDLVNMAQNRTNVIPIVEDARHPLRYRMLVPMVDCIFADVAQPDQARIVALNAHMFLKVGGGVVISIKANCIDSTAPAEAVFAQEVQKLRAERIKPQEQLTLEPYERSVPAHASNCYHHANTRTEITVSSSVNTRRPNRRFPGRGDWNNDLLMCEYSCKGSVVGAYLHRHRRNGRWGKQVKFFA